ncbi:hypothetical protein DMC64_20385 [Amycolatopsis sp. WAC 04197]|uniref:hypothetical protein n=1 Tax=Amycolatopsis sp. WAC 04197 TaxID=2203199 RepID=UPI000F795C43|nr:hypothetical protein [Amycolatopsis sp. WAC 04197]RSN45197.1 hypothetical protein DMC64_20385 [Amycolatopsis sp. WAC 04197]
MLLAARGTVQLAEGRNKDALSDFTACGAAPAFEHMASPAVLHWRAMAAFAATGCGRPDLAGSLADGERQAAKQYATPAGLGYALYVKAMVAGRGGTLTLLPDAVHLLEVAGARVELATACPELGRAWLAAGDFAKAAVHLSRAAELSRQIGDRRSAVEIGLELRKVTDAPIAESSLPRNTVSPARPMRASATRRSRRGSG